MDSSAYLNKRVVMTCRNSLSYAGVFRALVRTCDDREAAVVEVDSESGFSVLSPLDFITRLTVVPVEVEVKKG